MALKLTRRPGEAILLNYFSKDRVKQELRMTLRKQFRVQGMQVAEIQIHSTSDISMICQEGIEKVLDKDRFHLLSYSDDNNQTLFFHLYTSLEQTMIRLNLDFKAEKQLGFAIDAPRSIQIVRDELVDAA